MTATAAQLAAAQAALTSLQAAVVPMTTDAAVTTLRAAVVVVATDLGKVTEPVVPAVPAAPVLLSVSTAGVLTWTVPTGSDGIDVYVDGVKAFSSDWTKPPVPTTWTYTGIGSHGFTCTAYNDMGESAYSNAITQTIGVVPPPPPPTGKLLLGEYTDPQGSWSNATRFGTEVGCKMSCRTEYVSIGASTSWLGDLNYLLGLISGMPYRLCLGVPLVPSFYPPVFAPAASLVPLHQQMAAAIKAAHPTAIIRPNWELNIGTTSDFKNDVAGGIAAWKAIVPVYQEAGFLIEINTVPQGYWDVITLVEEPLLGYFDIVSVDPYDQSYATPIPNNEPNTAGNTSADVWATIAGGVDGLNALATFARANKKAMALAEWGVGNKAGGYGLGDDPLYIQNMAAFISANMDLFTAPGGYVSYFDDFPSGWDTKLADSPNSLAAFKKSFPALTG